MRKLSFQSLVPCVVEHEISEDCQTAGSVSGEVEGGGGRDEVGWSTVTPDQALVSKYLPS